MTNLTEVGKDTRFKKGNVPHNKGKKMPPELYAKASRTMFKKGHKPHNTRKDGDISLRGDKSGRAYKYIRISEANWQLLHRVVWEYHNGKIPKGHNVIFKDGNTMNCNIENLELVSNAENMKRNSFMNNYPEDIQKLIQLKGALNRQINKRRKNE